MMRAVMAKFILGILVCLLAGDVEGFIASRSLCECVRTRARQCSSARHIGQHLLSGMVENSVEVEHLGAKIWIPVRSGQDMDLSVIYQKLDRSFRLSEGTIITGFVVDPEGGGPSVPFGAWEGLRGGNQCRLVTTKTDVPAFMAPTPPQKMDPRVVDQVTVKWSDLESEDEGVQSKAIDRVLHGLREEGLTFIEMTDEQSKTWHATVQAALHFFDLDESCKIGCREELKNGKFVGYLRQAKREFFQLRKVDSESVFPWPPHADNALVERDFVACYNMLDHVARKLMRDLCQPLNLEWDQVKGMLQSKSDGGHMRGGKGGKLEEVGADVFRIFQLYRPEGSPLPGLQDAGTGLHADMGFITVAPTASLPGLTMLSKDCLKWLDVESSVGTSHDPTKEPPARFVVFTGETLARLTKGAVRAPLHYVDETLMGQKRISAPFFLRGRPDAMLPSMLGTQHENEMPVAQFMEDIVLSSRPWIRRKEETGMLSAIGDCIHGPDYRSQ